MENNNLLDHIHNAAQESMKYFDFLSSKILSLDSLHYRALLELERYTIMHLKQLSQILNLEKYTTSRLIAKLEAAGMCHVKPAAENRRFKLITLTPQGELLLKRIHATSNDLFHTTCTTLTNQEQDLMMQGLALYAHVLQTSRLQEYCKIRTLKKSDLPRLKSLMQQMHREYSYGNYPVDNIITTTFDGMHTSIGNDRCCYLVVTHNMDIVGYAAYEPVSEEYPHLCLIKSFYLSPAVRGFGIGKSLVEQLTLYAQKDTFTKCYFEMVDCSQQLCDIYKKLGFKQLEQPLIQTKQSNTSKWFIKDLAR